MGLVNKVKLSEIAQEKSLRFDISFIKFFASQKQEYYSYKDLFCIPAINNVNLSEIEELKYAEISNINKEGEVYPVHLCFDNKNEENESYFAKIEKGDIFKPQINSILLPSVRPYLNKNVLITDDELYFTKAMIQIKPKINPKLFYYCIRSIFFDLINAVSRQGKGYPTLKADDLKNIKFPKTLVDSILRQENTLVSNIESIEQEIQKLKKSKKLHLEIINEVFAKELKFNLELQNETLFKLSLLQISSNRDLRFSYKFHNPKYQTLYKLLSSKTSKKIKDFLDKPIELGKGITPSLYNEEGAYHYIAMSNIKNYYFEKENCKKISKDFYMQNINKSIEPNDILIARSGEGTIGKVAIIKNENIKGIFADFIMRIRLKNYNPLFAYYYFRSDFFQYLIYTHKKGLGNNTNIFPNQIQEFPLLDFPLEQQQAIAQKIKAQIDNQNFIDEQIKQKQQEISHLIISVLA